MATPKGLVPTLNVPSVAPAPDSSVTLEEPEFATQTLPDASMARLWGLLPTLNVPSVAPFTRPIAFPLAAIPVVYLPDMHRVGAEASALAVAAKLTAKVLASTVVGANADPLGCHRSEEHTS